MRNKVSSSKFAIAFLARCIAAGWIQYLRMQFLCWISSPSALTALACAIAQVLIVPNGDELRPYCVGGRFKDAPSFGESRYLSDAKCVQAAASSIHSAVLRLRSSLPHGIPGS